MFGYFTAVFIKILAAITNAIILLWQINDVRFVAHLRFSSLFARASIDFLVAADMRPDLTASVL